MVTIAKTVKVHDLESNQTSNILKRDDGKQSSLYSVMPFGHNIVSAGDDDGSIFVWDTRAPEEPIFSSYDCSQYISDIDGKFETRKLLVCTSGEGTLTAYDLRAKKMIEPQSELFETGFQCLKLLDANKKVVVGGEDGAIYVFNHNEWAHTSGKFAISDDARNRGKCCIDCLDVIPDSSVFLAGCSDGRIRSFTLWPHNSMGDKIVCKRKSVESIHVSPREGVKKVVVSGENYIDLMEYKENESSDEQESVDESASESDETSAESSEADKHADETPTNERATKKFKPDTEDYLNLFQ